MGNAISQNDSKRSDGDTRSGGYLRHFFLERLRRMVALRREQAPLLAPGDPHLRLLDKAVYSTFCDCLDLGAGDEARAILRHEGAAGGDEVHSADPN